MTRTCNGDMLLFQDAQSAIKRPNGYSRKVTVSAGAEDEETAAVLNCPLRRYIPDMFVPFGNHARKSETIRTWSPRDVILLGESIPRLVRGFLLNHSAFRVNA